MDVTLLEPGKKGLAESCEHQTLVAEGGKERARGLWRCTRCGTLFVEGRPPSHAVKEGAG